MKLCHFASLCALLLSTAASAAICRDIAVLQRGALESMPIVYPVRLSIADGRAVGGPGTPNQTPAPLPTILGIAGALYVTEGNADPGVDVRDLRGADLIVNSITKIDQNGQSAVYAVRLTFLDPSLNQKYVGPGSIYGICQE